MIREFSAGGLVIRNLSGRPHVAVVRVRDRILALPKGHPEEGESAQDAALREVREETGLEAAPVEKLGDIRYWYAGRRPGAEDRQLLPVALPIGPARGPRS